MPHRTHETHVAVLERYRIDSPLVTLDKLVIQALLSLTTALQSVSFDDVIRLNDWKPLHSTRTLLTSKLCQPVDISESESAPEEIACIYCAFVAPTKPELQRHMTLFHAQPRPLIRKVNYSQDAINGLPQCAHCNKMFLKWSGFKLHCMANVCGAPSSSSPTLTEPLIHDGHWEDTIEMEPGPLHQEFYDRALVFATEADYASVRGDRRLCDYLQYHCILCSKHLGSTKAITAHMRANHPAQLQEAIALGIQRMRQYTGNLSPCGFCMSSFNKTHLCPVFLQMGILELQAVAPDDPLHFTCFLCQFVAADRAQLKKHLTRLHQFPCHDWTPARDSLEDGVTCAHCGSVHRCQQALRKHVINGHCQQFDPSRPWTRNGDQDIVEHLTSGRVDLILANAEIKRKLTHDCQFCTQKFAQAANLVGHLLQQHSELANDGELYRQVLQQRFAPRGCSCVPRIKQYRSTHTCVLFHQLSMIHFNGNALLHIPVVYDDTARDRMDTYVPMKSYLLMHDALKSRDFELLQQDPTFRETLSKVCLCCGKQVTLTGPAKEHVLRHHLLTMHPEPQQAIQCLIQMVVNRKEHDHLTTCDWCGVPIMPTHANNEYDDHLAECPVLLHFATWLLIPLLPPPHGSRSGGSANPNPGRLGGTDGLRGTKRPHDEEATNTSMGIKAAFERQRNRFRSSGTTENSVPALPSHPSTRERSELLTPAEHLHPLHVNREGRPDDPDLADQHPMEAAATTTEGFPIPSSMLGAPCDANPGATGHKSDGMQERRSFVAVEHPEQAGTSRPVMAISQVGSSEESLGGRHQSQQSTDERSHADLGPNLQNYGTSRSHCEVSCVAEQNEAGPSDSLEIGTGHEGSKIAQSPPLTGELQCVATGAITIETSSSTTVKTCRRPYEAQQEKVDRSKYCHILSELVLVNDDVQCYVNASFLTILWTHMMCGDFNMGSWGDETAVFLDLLKDGVQPSLCLRGHAALQPGFSQWQQLRGECSNTQQDYGEFLQYFLKWINSRLVVMTTSRRFLVDDAVVVAEKSDATSPILLYAELWDSLPAPICFQTILDQWHHTHGMMQAIEQASHILCFQICRFQDAHTIDRTILEFGNLRAFVTCFIDDRLCTARIPYQIAALVHYHGNSRGGHYNCVIAYLDKYGDLQWLFHDDNKPPVTWAVLPEWFLADITHVWMIRGDTYLQWKQPAAEASSQENALAHVLAHLRES